MFRFFYTVWDHLSLSEGIEDIDIMIIAISGFIIVIISVLRKFFPPIFFSFWPGLLVQFCQCIIWVNENNAEIRGTLNNQPVSPLHCLAFWYPQRWSTPLTIQFFPLLAPQSNLTSCQNVTSYKLQRKHRLSRLARKILTQHPWLSCFPCLLSAKASWSWMRFNGRGSICVATSERQVTLLALSG